MRPLPTTQDESWRYSPINDLDLDGFVAGEALVSVNPADPAVVVETSPLADLARLDYPEPDGLTDLHDRFAEQETVVRIPKGKVASGTIEVLVTVAPGKVASFPHVVIEAGEASEATVVLTAIGGDGGALSVPVVELRIGQAANLRFVSSQQLAADAWQLGHLLASVGRDATLRGWLVATGGGYAREYVSALLPEQGATAKIAGVYFGDERQVIDFRSLQDHVGSRSISDFQLKGAVVDEAHGVYTGLIRVQEGAKATESFLGNRNLVLGEGAHVDSVPNLEIVNENDIRSCGHAAATGPVDEEHMFYLESRGVPTLTAERLIVTGFFEEILESIPVGGVADAARHIVSRKLEKVTSA
ncbi:MAG TPA: SufD family Fe-S cluster assembly protein [Acidimicrobiales bacterium]|jgi:Fe-S cluster assembly protein SufD|nr:SufD family Fe-S cluster assembly protein [Acidimicrobiales bacterium]